MMPGYPLGYYPPENVPMIVDVPPPEVSVPIYIAGCGTGYWYGDQFWPYRDGCSFYGGRYYGGPGNVNVVSVQNVQKTYNSYNVQARPAARQPSAVMVANPSIQKHPSFKGAVFSAQPKTPANTSGGPAHTTHQPNQPKPKSQTKITDKSQQ